jgi:hypothetical protein
MDDRRTRAAADEERRRRVKHRAKRGLVAGYIHELSARHGTAGRSTDRVVAVAEAGRG